MPGLSVTQGTVRLPGGRGDGSPSPNVTSGRHLIDILRRDAGQGGVAQQKYDLGFDVYIKQRSYALLNKTFFAAALVAACCTGLWPMVVVLQPFYHGLDLFGSAVMQTMITGFAAFTVYIYQTYKKRQTAAENLLRLIVFSSMPMDRLVSTVMDEMSRLDQGMGFRVGKQPDEPDTAHKPDAAPGPSKPA